MALLDRDPVVDDVAQEAAVHGVDTFAAQVDVTDFAALQATAARVEQELGPVRHVVFTVGIDSGKGGFPFWNLEPSRLASCPRSKCAGCGQHSPCLLCAND